METKPDSQVSRSGYSQDILNRDYQSDRPSGNNSDSQWDMSVVFGTFRRKWPTIVSIIVTVTAISALVAVVRSIISRPSYEGSFQLLVEPVTTDDQMSRLFLQAQQTESFNPNINQSRLDYETQVRILQSQRLLNPVLEKLKNQYPKLNYDLLVTNLEIKQISYKKDGKEEGTKMLEVTYTAPATDMVINVLSQVSDAYLQYSLTERQTNIRQGIRFIGDQLPILQQRVDNLQLKLQELRSQNTLTNPEAQGQKLLEQLNQIDLQRLDTQTKLGEAQVLYATLQGQFSTGNYTVILGERLDYQKLLERAQELEGQLADETARSRPANPVLQALKERQQNSQNLLRQEAEKILIKASDQLTILDGRNQSLTQSSNLLRQQIQRLAAISRQYANLQRELQVATESLNKFLAKREALQIDAAQQEVPWELITPPTLNRSINGEPINAAAVSKVRLLAIGVVLGVLLGIGVAFLQEILANVFHSPDEIKRASKLPILGAIPRLRERKSDLHWMPFHDQWIRLQAWFVTTLSRLPQDKRFPLQDQKLSSDDLSLFTEAFYCFFTNLRLLSTINPVRSLVISSPSSQDGKSTIAIHLAQAAAATGQRVLLVDANFRDPKIHEHLNLSRTNGFSDVLGNNRDFLSLLQRPLPESNLFILTSGHITHDPIQLLSTPNIKTLMEEFVIMFDLVIYDTPPFLQFADANLMAARTDGLVLVICLEQTTSAALHHTLDNLKLSSTKLLGVVVNAMCN
jgi:succinoglycan biosynthesis transport protein ExoP